MKDYSVSHVNTNTLAFPQTAAVMSTTPTSTDGTEYVKDGIDDNWGFSQALLNEVGVSPNGLSETYLNSQKLEAIRAMVLTYGTAYRNTGRPDTDFAHDVILTTGHLPANGRTFSLRRTSEISKQGDVAWVAGGVPGSPAGGLMGGSWLPNTEYGVFEIYNPTTKARDAGFSVYTMNGGVAIPSFLPLGYTVYRMADWVKTDGASNIIQTTTIDLGGGRIRKIRNTPGLDINLLNTLTTTRRLDAVFAPTGFKTLCRANLGLNDAANFYAFIGDPDFVDADPSGLAAASIYRTGGLVFDDQFEFYTNTLAQVAARSSLAAIDVYALSVKEIEFNRISSV